MNNPALSWVLRTTSVEIRRIPLCSKCALSTRNISCIEYCLWKWLSDAGETVLPRDRNEVVNVETGLTDESIGGIIGALLTALLIILAVAIFVVLRRRRRRRKYPAGTGFIEGTRNVGGATVKCSAGLASRGGVCGSGGPHYDPAVGGVANGNVAVVNGNGYDVTSASDVESDGTACCGGAAGGRRINGRGPAIEFYHVPSGRLPELPKTPDSSGDVRLFCFAVLDLV